MSIYLDHAASTPVHPEVLEAMLPFYRNDYGNPSSTHAFGRAARYALTDSRDLISSSIGCKPSELTFTSGGTESDNMALFGAARQLRHKGKHIITTQIEHHAVLHSCEQLEREGYDVSYISVDQTGRIDMRELEAAIRQDTVLISVMHVNNEVGTVQPIADIGSLARGRGILFHVDAVQSLGHIPLRLNEWPIDMMSFSAHKINGPKGIGALYTSGRVKLEPILFGGLQEKKRRAGTENVASIAGFAKAVEISTNRLHETQQMLEKLRQVMVEGLRSELGDGFVVNGHPELRTSHILNASFLGVSTESMLMNLDLDGIAAASGSACTSGSLEVSHVLQAMGLPGDVTSSAVRFSFGLGNDEQQMKEAANKVATIARRIRINH